MKIKGIIWSINEERGLEQLEKLKEKYKFCGYKIVNERKGMVIFDNDDYWRVHVPKDGTRGARANLSYIDRALPTSDINIFVLPATIGYPCCGIWYFGEEPEDV